MKTQFITIISFILMSNAFAFTRPGLYRMTELKCLPQFGLLKAQPGDTVFTNAAWTTFGEDGTVQFSAETIRLLSDAEYRESAYPPEYTLSQMPDLLNEGKIALAMWTLINLYSAQPDQVRTIAFILASHGIHGPLYLNAFYTYVFADPEVFHFATGRKPFLEHPERMQQKLDSCRALAAYTDKYLELQSGGH